MHAHKGLRFRPDHATHQRRMLGLIDSASIDVDLEIMPEIAVKGRLGHLLDQPFRATPERDQIGDSANLHIVD